MTNSSPPDFSELPDPPVKVIYSGRVQGVGFRWTCEKIARGHNVTGTVRNLPDGTVELYADGATSAVASFLAEIEAEMMSNIRETSINSVTKPVSLEGFQIIR